MQKNLEENDLVEFDLKGVTYRGTIAWIYHHKNVADILIKEGNEHIRTNIPLESLRLLARFVKD